jgi:uncharacterized membrane protein YjjP (DUF1212 family)
VQWIFVSLSLALLVLCLRILPGKRISVPMIAVVAGIAMAIFEYITRNFALSAFLCIAGSLIVAFVPSSKAL